MTSKTEVRRHVEKAFEFMIKTHGSDGRGGPQVMQWHAERLIEVLRDVPADLQREAIFTAKMCAMQPLDDITAKDASCMYRLFAEGLEGAS